MESVDLTQCPKEVQALDQNADVLWLKLLRKSGIAMSSDKKRVIDNDGKRAHRVRSIGIPDLLFRLQCQRERESRAGAAQDDIKRARIWWHVAESCREGESIPDLTSENLYLLNPFVVPSDKKFPFPQIVASEEDFRPCANRRCAVYVTGRVQYCSEACSKAARMRRFREKLSLAKVA